MVALLVADRDGRYLEANDEALELFGVTLEQLRASRIGTFSGPHADLALTVWRRLAANDEDMSSGEGTIFRPDGSRIRVRYERIEALGNGTYELEATYLGMDEERLQTPPISDRPAILLSKWRAAEREVETASVEGPGAMGAPEESQRGAEALRRLYQDSLAHRDRDRDDDGNGSRERDSERSSERDAQTAS
jgi:PAS domain S-box-containing protein